MKKVIKFLPVMAILLGSGLAVASHSTYTVHNVKNSNPGTGTPTWVAIGSGETVNCNQNTARQCKAYRDEFGNISNIEYGYQQ